MARWHHWLNGCESEWTPRVGDGQGGLACCYSWDRRVGHDWVTEVNWTELNWTEGGSEHCLVWSYFFSTTEASSLGALPRFLWFMKFSWLTGRNRHYPQSCMSTRLFLYFKVVHSLSSDTLPTSMSWFLHWRLKENLLQISGVLSLYSSLLPSSLTWKPVMVSSDCQPYLLNSRSPVGFVWFLSPVLWPENPLKAARSEDYRSNLIFPHHS